MSDSASRCYAVCAGNNVYELAERVSDRIRQGWQPTGGPVYVSGQWNQAIWRPVTATTPTLEPKD